MSDERVESQDKLIDRVRVALRPLGYAVGVHGSRERDLDLIAAPWVEDAEASPYVICDALRGAGFDELGMGAVESPHGRLGFALHGVPASAGVKYIDLSVLLPSSREAAEAERDEAIADRVIAERTRGEWQVQAEAECRLREDVEDRRDQERRAAEAEVERLKGKLLRYESMGAVRAVAEPLWEALKHAEREALAIHASVDTSGWRSEAALSIALQARAALSPREDA